MHQQTYLLFVGRTEATKKKMDTPLQLRVSGSRTGVKQSMVIYIRPSKIKKGEVCLGSSSTSKGVGDCSAGHGNKSHTLESVSHAADGNS